AYDAFMAFTRHFHISIWFTFQPVQLRSGRTHTAFAQFECSQRRLSKPMTSSVQKILILGGYGTFGRRLAQLLTDDSRLTLVIAGRSLTKAQKLCAEL